MNSVKEFATECARTMLPDTSVIGPGEDAEEASRALEEFCWDDGEGAPEDVSEAAWRAACRAALVDIIERARSRAK